MKFVMEVMKNVFSTPVTREWFNFEFLNRNLLAPSNVKKDTQNSTRFVFKKRGFENVLNNKRKDIFNFFYER